MLHYYGERAVRRARLVRAAAGRLEHALHLLPGRVGGHVDVGARPPEQRIAHEAAHAPCLSSGLLDDFQSIMGDKRKGERLGKIAPNRFAGSKFIFTSSTASDRFVRLRRV